MNCGTVGISIITKRHRGTKKCLNTKEKRDKKGKGKVQKSLLAFMRPKPTPVPSTVASTSSQVHGIEIPAIGNDDHRLELDLDPEQPAGDATLSMERVSNKNGSGFVARLQAMVESIPESVPEGLENDRLAQFSVNPQIHDDPSLDADGLWEEVLNSFLKGALGWGTEQSMDDVVRRGAMGMGGILQFARYFIEERGVNEILFEGKLSHLLNAVEKVYVTLEISEIMNHLPDCPESQTRQESQHNQRLPTA